MIAPINSDGANTVARTIGSNTASIFSFGNSDGFVTIISLPSPLTTR